MSKPYEQAMGVRFQRPLLQQVTDLSQEMGVSRNRLIGIALQEFLERRTIGLTQVKNQ